MSNSKKHLDSIFKNQKTLKQMAEREVLTRKVPATYPGTVFERPLGRSIRVYTPTMKASIWGKPENMTVSLLKTDVFDRRYIRSEPFTMDQVVKGAFSEANKDYDDMPYIGMTRPKYGALMEDGGRRDHQAWSEIYPFPCQKPVGQIIVKAKSMEGAEQPDADYAFKNGLVKINMQNDKTGSKLGLEYLLSMKRNIVAVDVKYENVKDISFRLYRHLDQGHRRYMDAEGNFIPEKDRYIVFHPVNPNDPVEYYSFEKDADINGPIEAPQSGCDGRFFWIKQKLPAESTFPDGFEYVMMALVSDESASVTNQKLQTGLGTPPGIPRDSEGNIIIEEGTNGHNDEILKMEKYFGHVRKAPGVAGTAAIDDAGSGRTKLYVTVCTVNETQDFMEQAKAQLLDAERQGYEALVEENNEWYDALYARREHGRITVHAKDGRECEEIDRQMLYDAHKSWAISDGGFCSPLPSRYEGSEIYAAFEIDSQSWHSLPCYNEIFSEPYFVRNQYEAFNYYLDLVETWHDALIQKAHDLFGLPGMTIAHGYLPPAKPDPWYVENQTLDYTLEVPGQVMKALWNMYDYCGDEEILKKRIYPVLRDLAIFYEAFARRNYDGEHYNLLPMVETESWGFSYQLKHATNTTGAITIFRKILNIAAESAEKLGVDSELISGWKEVAENLPPYPTFLVGTGEILAGNPGAMPRWSSGDHGHFTGDYPATLGDDINLDSPEEDKELMIRTMDTVRTPRHQSGYILVGAFKDHIPCNYNTQAILIDDEKTLTSQILLQPERLLNSRSGRIYLFPVTPDWAEVSFDRLHARGGFEVSASKDKGGVKAVTVAANLDETCSIMNPWAGKDVAVTNTATGEKVAHRIDKNSGECIIFEAVKGNEYSIDLA